MLIIHGVYHLCPKRMAFRNDYCLSCGQPRRSVLTRTFDIWHVFWIPLLPVGFWKRWICTTCLRRPHVNRKTRRPFKWAGLFIMLTLSMVFWAVPVMPDAVIFSWSMRVGTLIGAVLLLIHLLRTPKEASLKELLSTVATATDTVCPFCGAQMLMLSSGCNCPNCGVIRV
jgi:hypothetical protein